MYLGEWRPHVNDVSFFSGLSVPCQAVERPLVIINLVSCHLATISGKCFISHFRALGGNSSLAPKGCVTKAVCTVRAEGPTRGSFCCAVSPPEHPCFTVSETWCVIDTGTWGQPSLLGETCPRRHLRPGDKSPSSYRSAQLVGTQSSPPAS